MHTPTRNAQNPYEENHKTLRKKQKVGLNK